MMTIAEVDQTVFDEAATFITYAKIFPHALKDFITRKDAKEMMKSSNLLVNVNPGQLVSTAGGPVAQSGSTTSPGKGQVNVVYNGSAPTPGSKVLEQEVKAKKEAGGTAVSGLTEGVSKATGA